MQEEEEAFRICEISEERLFLMPGESCPEDCPLPAKELRCLYVLHKDAEGSSLQGEMIVNRPIAKDLPEIFQALYDAGCPIGRIRPVDDYDGGDTRSMEDNNSSCFSFRFIAGTEKLSRHGCGLAVDINPLYNPFVKEKGGELTVQPASAPAYADREASFPYKIEAGDLCCELFAEHGFTRGGNWSSHKDYQHFEFPDEEAERFMAREKESQ